MSKLGVPAARESMVAFAPPSVLELQTATWGAVQVETTAVQRHEPFEYTFTAPRHLLIASERVNRDDGETQVEGLPKSHLRAWNRKLTFVPAEHRFYGWQKPRALSRGTHLYIDPRSPLLQSLGFAETQFRPRLFFFDRDLWETVLKLRRQVKSPDGSQLAYVETLSLVLAHELMRMNQSVPALDSRQRGGLPGWQQTKLMQHIDEHLAENISLSSLAELVQLSPFHFARAFKQSFGLPPHRYLTSRRIARAKNLLADRRLSVTEIGFDIGFSEASAFTSAFRKVTGETPTDYRRSLA